jgi:glycosyltransferase involved in cell wall biosynthesis
MESRRSQIMVAQLGARMHYAVPALLQRARMLAHFYTDTYVGPGSAWHVPAQATSIIPGEWRPSALRHLLDRQERALSSNKVTAFNWLGLAYALALKRARNEEGVEECYFKYGERFCELILRHSFENIDGVYAFEGAALPLFLRAQKLGITKILEKCSAPQQLDYELVAAERLLWEGWEPPYPNREVFQKRIDLEQSEWKAADAIICGSDFVSRGLAQLGVAPEKLHTVPYGVKPPTFSAPRQPWDGRRPLRLLFVGGVSLRKGVQYFYEAIKKVACKQVSARIVGPLIVQLPYQRLLAEVAELTGQVPRQEVIRHYQWADVFVFPSICEGSATVTYEALAAGLPVITSPNAGSVVRDGVEGFLVPIRDAEALAAKIELLLQDRDLLAQMSQNAQARSRDFNWERYEERLVSALLHIMSAAQIV